MLDYAIFFIVYAFLGWVCEEVYCSVKQKKFVIRGFLYGPLCPIYGVGAILMIFFLSPYTKHWYLVFIIAFVALSILEYLTSYFMEKIFRMRWWDYSNYKLNINGRVCLLNSILFGMLAMILLYVLNPFISNMCDKVNEIPKIILVISFYLLFIGDLVMSIISAAKTSSSFKKYISLIKDEGKVLKEKLINTKFPGFFLRHTLRNFPKIFNVKNKISLKDLIHKIKERKQKENE